jgi:hydrogenase nickel incorporation protein HypA/HybF
VHELALAVAIVDLVERHAAGRRVGAVGLKVGALRQVVPRSLEFHFAFAARGSVCEGALLEQERVAALLRCGDCGNRWDPAPPAAETTGELAVSFRCPACGSARFHVVRGEELEVESIEVVADAGARPAGEEERCTAPR